jgi:hypothetical protein
MADNKVDVVFGAQVAGLISGVHQVKEEIESVRSPVDQLVKDLSGIGEAAGVAFAVEKIAEWTEHVAEAAEKLVNLSETFGTSADRLKEFQNILTLAGGEGENVTRVIIGLGRAIEASLKDPLSKQRDAFRAIGISMEELRAKAEDPLEVIDLLRQRFSALAPDFQRTEAFTQALGFRFYQLVPILKLTNEEYEKWRQAQAKTGANASGIKELDELEGKIKELNLAFEGFGKTFVLNLVDPIKAGVEWITKLTEAITKAIDLTGTVKPIPEGGASAAIPPRGATPEETETLAQIRQKESGNRYDILHGPGGKSSGTITDFSQFPQWGGFGGPAGKSHAAGAYGFEPGTYADISKSTGLTDFSKESQDANALALLRQKGLKPWAASMGSEGEAGGGEGGKQKTGEIPDSKGDYKSTIAGLDLEQKKNKENYEQWLELETEKLSKIASVYGADSEEYKTELGKQLEYTKQNASEELAIQLANFSAYQSQAKASFEKEKAQGEQAVTLGKETRAKMLSDLIAELDNEHAEEDKALLNIRDNYATTEKERQKLNDQLIKMDAQYQAQRAHLLAEETAEITKEQAKQLKIITDGFDTLGKSLTSAFNGLLLGQETWAQAAKKIYQDVGNFFLDTVEKMAAKWAASGLASAIGNAATQTAVSTAQASGGTGLGELFASLIGPLIGLTTITTGQSAATVANTAALIANTAALTVSAVAGAAGGLGGAASAALMAAVLVASKGGIVPSAQSGWQLPSLGGGGTLAQLHSNEMVLPANISQGLQGAINGGSFGGGGGGHTFNMNISAMDGASVMKHGPAIVNSINSALRNGSQLRSNGSY